MKKSFTTVVNCFLVTAAALALMGLAELLNLFCVIQPVFFNKREILLFLYIFAGFYFTTAFLLAAAEGVVIYAANIAARHSPRGVALRASIYTACALPPLLRFSARIFTGRGISSRLALLDDAYHLPFHLSQILPYAVAACLIALTYCAVMALVKWNEALLAGKIAKPRLSLHLCILFLAILALYWAHSRLYVRLYEYVHTIAALVIILFSQLLVYGVIAFIRPEKFTGPGPCPASGMARLILFIGLIFVPGIFVLGEYQNIKIIALVRTSLERKMIVYMDALVQKVSGVFGTPYSITGTTRERVFVDRDFEKVFGEGGLAYPLEKAFSHHRLIEDPGKLNVLYIVIDTLRADHLSCYGYNRDTSPAIDSLAREGTLFLNNYSQASDTNLSMVPLFTSRYFFSLGTDPSGNPYEELTGRLRENRIISYAFQPLPRSDLHNPAWYPLTRIIHGFDRIFDRENRDPTGVFKAHSREGGNGFFGWLRPRGKGKRFFIWLHLGGPHHPYTLKAGYDFGARPMDRYDAQVKYNDHLVGVVLEALEAYGLKDTTIVVLNADHGEEFKEHGGELHATTLYNELIHVPLIIRIPSVPAGKVSSATGNIDIVPTLLDILNIPPHAPMHGSSLVPLIRGEEGGGETVFAENSYAMKSAIHKEWKFIYNFGTGSEELYNLLFDQKELLNMADWNRPKALELKRRLALHTLAEYQIGKDSTLLDRVLSVDRGATIDSLAKILESNDRSKQLKAMEAIEKLPDERVLKPLIRSLSKQSDGALIAKAIPSIARFKKQESVSALKRFVSYPDEGVRKEALRALAGFNDPDIGRDLQELVRNGEERNILQAAEWISSAEEYKKKGEIGKAHEFCVKAMSLDKENPRLKRIMQNCNDARFVSQDVPLVMQGGGIYQARITMRNTGFTPWNRPDGYRLASQNPQDNFTWGPRAAELTAAPSVAPGESVTFSLTVIAPSQPGDYNFQWQMLKEHVEWFGEPTPNAVVTVISGT